MSKSSPLIGLAGAIATKDWPDPAPALAALTAMMSQSSERVVPAVEARRLGAAVTAVSDARKRRRAEHLKQRKRQAVGKAVHIRNKPTLHVSTPFSHLQPLHDEPEMEI